MHSPGHPPIPHRCASIAAIRMISGAAGGVRTVVHISATCVVGVIYVLLVIPLARLTEVMKPLRVQAFRDGVVVGLFCVPLSRGIAELTG